MQLYRVASTLFHPYCYAIIKDSAYDDEISKFFGMNLGNKEEIEEISMEFVANKGYTLDNIAKTDYIFSFSALLFSKKFVDTIGDFLKNEMQFFPCKVICQGIALDWYAAQIIRLLPVVDKKASIYRKICRERCLDLAKYRTDIIDPFYIARDDSEISRFVVSDEFRKLCNNNGIMIDFLEANEFE